MNFYVVFPMHIMYNSFKIGSLRIHQLVRRILDIIMRPCLLFVVSVCCRCEGDGITYPLSGNRISVHYVGKLAATRQFQATGFREFSSWFSMGSVAPKKALQFRFGSKICPGKNKTAKMLRIGWYSFPGSAIANLAQFFFCRKIWVTFVLISYLFDTFLGQ